MMSYVDLAAQRFPHPSEGLNTQALGLVPMVVEPVAAVSVLMISTRVY